MKAIQVLLTVSCFLHLLSLPSLADTPKTDKPDYRGGSRREVVFTPPKDKPAPNKTVSGSSR